MAEPRGSRRTPSPRRLTAVVALVALLPLGVFAWILLGMILSPPANGTTTADLRHHLAVALGWSLAALAPLVIVAAYLMARRITRPVARLTEAAQAMAVGKSGARVEDVQGVREFDALASAFNVMAGTLERQDQLRRRLVADVAHELRTPIAVLQAWVEAMIDGVADLTPENLSALLDETLRLTRIVRDLEVLASSDVAALTMRSERVDLTEVASQAAAAVEARVANAGLTLDCHLGPAFVTGDKERLHQVIANLLTNAIKFTPAGGRVSLSVGRAGKLAQIVVEDTGVGIPPDELPHVFQRFWRGHAAQGMTGSGIGLAVVAGLAEAHGGGVEAASNGRQGARFVVTLPHC